MSTTHPIKDKKQITQLADYFKNRGEYRNYALVVVSTHTALRISDLLSLRWRDVYDFNNNRIRENIALTEQKTGKNKSLQLHQTAIRAIMVYMMCGNINHNDYIFRSRKGGAISRIQAYRIIRAAAESLMWDYRVSGHSLRKTFGYHAWKSGVSPVLIMEIYNHSSFSVTRRYLGIDQDDKNKVYSTLELFE
jgi:integrase